MLYVSECEFRLPPCAISADTFDAQTVKCKATVTSNVI
jgi:hypothetical protein